MQALISNAIITQDKRRDFTFSSTGGLKESERALTTHLHELGHMVHDTAARRVSGKTVGFPTNAMSRAPYEVQQVFKASRGPTDYSNTNIAELFAESFTAYVLAPTALQQSNPDLYGWVKTTTRKARENAVASAGATMISIL